MTQLIKDYFRSMFVRKKNNPSGIVSVQVLDKSDGKSRLVKTIGSSANPAEVESLVAEGKKWITTHLGQQDMFEQVDQEQEEKQAAEYVFSNIENILFNGT